MGYLPWDKPVEIEVVSGAFFMMRRASLEKVGLLDEDFFMYGEDIDLSYRLLRRVYIIGIIPQPFCTIRERARRRVVSAMCTCSMRRCSSSSESTSAICRGFSAFL
jgi:hypothetical protein